MKKKKEKKEKDIYAKIAQLATASGLKLKDPTGSTSGNDQNDAEIAKEIKYKARPHQGKILQSKKELIFMGGGVGSGKTDAGGLWLLKKCESTPKGVVGLVCANSYSQLIDSTLWNVYRNFGNWGVDVRPRDLPKVHRPFNINVWNGRHFIEIRCRSLDAYELLSGQEIGWAWADEVFLTKKEAIDVVLARMRDKRMTREYGVLGAEIAKFSYKPEVVESILDGAGLQMLFTTALDEPTSWMYAMFVDNYSSSLMDVIYARTADNLKNLPPGYISRLQTIYTKAMFQRMVECEWVTLEGGKIYYNFKRNKHISSYADFDPDLPVIWSHDFNIGVDKPMSNCLCQIKRGKDLNNKHRPELHVFDEIVVQTADTSDIVEEFISRAWVAPDAFNEVEIHGDASGRAHDTRSKTTDYGILESAGFTNQQQPSRNPPIRDRHNSVNALLENAAGDIRLLIHPRCKNLIKGMETVHLKEGANYSEVETQEQHVTTALGYAVNELFPADPMRGKVVAITGF